MNLTEREQTVIDLIKQNKIDNHISEYENEIISLEKKGVLTLKKILYQGGDYSIGGIKLNDNYFA